MSDPDGPAARVNLRSALRRAFRHALEALAADGVVALGPDEIGGLLEQVRETADAKFGDYSGTMAMALATRAAIAASFTRTLMKPGPTGSPGGSKSSA